MVEDIKITQSKHQSISNSLVKNRGKILQFLRIPTYGGFSLGRPGCLPLQNHPIDQQKQAIMKSRKDSHLKYFTISKGSNRDLK